MSRWSPSPSPAAQRAWRDDPAHRAAQQQGRDDFYLDYSIQVGACTHVSRWTRETDAD